MILTFSADLGAFGFCEAKKLGIFPASASQGTFYALGTLHVNGHVVPAIEIEARAASAIPLTADHQLCENV